MQLPRLPRTQFLPDSLLLALLLPVVASPLSLVALVLAALPPQRLLLSVAKAR